MRHSNASDLIVWPTRAILACGLAVLTTPGGCASSGNSGWSADPGVGADSSAGDGGRGAAVSTDGAPPTCGTALNREGCACTPSSPARDCFSGTASEAGVGACTFGHQTCVAQGESGGAWGPCMGSGSPTTCVAAGAQCGTIQDGCGGVLDCGSCPAGQTCGGGGGPNVCGNGPCVPATTCAPGLDCGVVPDGCGGTIDCGTCSMGQTCGGGGMPNRCGCTPTTCAAQGATCGTLPDGCGGTLDCGTCVSPQTCGGGGVANQCGGGACGALQQGCFATSKPMDPVNTTVTSPQECQAYCNSVPNTVCCTYLDPCNAYQNAFCWANTDPACKTPRAACFDDGWTCNYPALNCQGSNPNVAQCFWGTICQ